MDRRDALKALTSLAGATGLTVTPVMTHDASTDVALLVLTCPHPMTREQAERLKAVLETGLKGTPLEGVRSLVMDNGLRLEVVRSARTARGE